MLAGAIGNSVVENLTCQTLRFSPGAAVQSGYSTSAMFAAAGRAVVSSTITQGIAVATGLQSKFNWSGVALAGMGAGVGYSVGQSVFQDWGGNDWASGARLCVWRGCWPHD